MINYKYINLLMLMAAVIFAMSCQKDEVVTPRAESSIAFSGDVQEQTATRANNGLFNIQKSMKLYGTKTVGGVTKEVFPNYRLQYIDDSKTWEYEANKDELLAGQIVKYWDHDATRYDFIAGAPYDHTTISADGKTVTLSGLKMESGTASSYVSTPYLFSEPKTIASTDFDKTVLLTFKLAICRVKVAFIFKEAQTGSEGKVTLTDIDFAPVAPATYTVQGSVAVNFAGSSPAYTVTPEETASNPLDFQNVTINYPGDVTPTFSEEFYYMIPLSSTANASAWTMTVGSLTEKNTAIVPAANMKWEPGHSYVYKFELSSAKTDPTIKFIECVNTAITEWTAATSSDATLYNW